MAESGHSQWRDYISRLSEADAVLPLLPDTSDEDGRQEAFRMLFQNLSGGYFSAFSDPDRPDFVPCVNNIFNAVGANPDFIYGYTKIDGAGSYRISGYRGTGLFILLDITAGGLGVMDTPGPSVGTLDIDTLRIKPDGAFDVLLSNERPTDYDGDWFYLDPSAKTILMRQAAYDWGGAIDARIAIDRIDIFSAPRRLDANAIAERLDRLASYPQALGSFAIEHIKGLRDRGAINQLEFDNWAGRGGVTGQYYYQGLIQIQPGEALILETELPDEVRYWNVQLSDPLWNAIDWMNHQSSLNGGQAQIDGDGRFRAVVAQEDPGVPNWLDPAGHQETGMMIRWNEASSGPTPSLRVVPLAEVRTHLPSDTPVVTVEKRQTMLRQRRRSVQMRRRW